jgi:hypothetical protein
VDYILDGEFLKMHVVVEIVASFQLSDLCMSLTDNWKMQTVNVD